MKSSFGKLGLGTVESRGRSQRHGHAIGRTMQPPSVLLPRPGIFVYLLRGALLLLTVVLYSAGCSSTKITGIWRDEAYQAGRIRNVLVITAAHTATVRRYCESEFAKLLRRHGLKAVESFTMLPDDGMNDTRGRDAVIAMIKEQGIDAVLMTRSIGTRTATQTIPGINIYVAPFGSYGAWSSYYGAAYTFPASPPSEPGVTHERTYLVMETVLFDARTEQPVWSARSETLVSRDPEQEIRPYINLVCDKLFSARLL